MTQNDILEGNKLIAEFNGDYFDIGLEPAYYINFNKEYILENSKYHASWDWLMPVCKKIIQMYFDKRENIFSGLNKCDIYLTWLAVIEFIKFWNDPIQIKINFKNEINN